MYRKEEERKQEIRKTGMEITKINQHFTYYLYWLIDPCIFLIRSMRLKGPNVEKRRHVCINQLISMFSVPMSLLQRERLASILIDPFIHEFTLQLPGMKWSWEKSLRKILFPFVLLLEQLDISKVKRRKDYLYLLKAIIF